MKEEFLKIIYTCTALALILQILIDFSIENIISALITCIISLIAFTYLFDKNAYFYRYPISCLIIFGFNITNQSGALLYQTLNWTPISFNLNNPIETFFYSGIELLTLLLAHKLYAQSGFYHAMSRAISTKVINGLGFFKIPSNSMLWTSGFIGMFAVWQSTGTEINYGDIGGKFMVAFIPFVTAPYLIPFLNRFTVSNKDSSFKSNLIFLYTFLLIVIAFIKNSRGFFAAPIFTFILIYMLFWVTGYFKINKQQLMKFFFWLIPLGFLFYFISGISKAMLIVRANREGVSGLTMINDTISVFLDPNEIAAYDEMTKYAINNAYNETYISNSIFARLITIKFDDNMLSYYKLLTQQDASQLLDISINKIWAILPAPILNVFITGFNKTDFEFSIGDAIYSLVSGTEFSLGGYRTGSIVVHGLILMGPFFYVLLLMFIPIVYSLFDSFYKHVNGKIFFFTLHTFNSLQYIYFFKWRRFK